MPIGPVRPLLLSRGGQYLRDHRSFYRGYAIFISGAETAWSFRAEPTYAELPILALAGYAGHESRGEALRMAKREIDRLLSE